MPTDCPIFMREDVGLATRYRHHQQKLVLFFSAMRHFAVTSERRVIYQSFGSDSLTYLEALTKFCQENGIVKVWFYPPNDSASFDLSQFEIPHTVLPESPMFVTPTSDWLSYTTSTGRRQMSDFYIRQRKRMNILVNSDGYWGVGNYLSFTAIPANNATYFSYLLLHEFGHFFGLSLWCQTHLG